MEYTQYTTREGDRWDLIAYRAYGDANNITPIVEANKGIAIDDVLRAGVVLNIPVLARAEADKSLLPPWKR